MYFKYLFIIIMLNLFSFCIRKNTFTRLSIETNDKIKIYWGLYFYLSQSVPQNYYVTFFDCHFTRLQYQKQFCIFFFFSRSSKLGLLNPEKSIVGITSKNIFYFLFFIILKKQIFILIFFCFLFFLFNIFSQVFLCSLMKKK